MKQNSLQGRYFIICCTLMLLLASHQTSFAQKAHKNSFTFWCAQKYVSDGNLAETPLEVYDFMPFYPDYVAEDYGIYYERIIKKHFKLGGGCSQWNRKKPLSENTELEAFFIDSIHTRIGYRMIDIYAGYVLPIGRHTLSGSIGWSYAFGTNSFIDTFLVNPANHNDIMPTFRYETNVGYHGAMAMISYDYALFRNRFSVGIDYKLRMYHKIYVGYFLSGMHLKVNF